VRSVNQRMVDRMIALRRQGFSHLDIARQLRCSERTVRRHTHGVSPQLMHAGDQTGVDLLEWGVRQFGAAQHQRHLTLQELDLAIKRWRAAVSALDPLTVERLERDAKLRGVFFDESWPRIHLEIDTRRLNDDREPL